MMAIGYIRVSTADQANEGVSLDAQKAKLSAWCAVNDHEIGEIYMDAGLSGKRADNRPALQEALEAVFKSKGILVVYSLSRLARSTKDTLAIAERLDRSGADLVSLSEKIDTTTAAGKMVFRMLAVLAEFERDLVSERTRSALAHKIGKGERCGKIRFGFDLAVDGRTLTPNTLEQEAIAIMKELRAAGESYRAIAEQLDRRGIQAKEGKRWVHTTVRQILARAV